MKCLEMDKLGYRKDGGKDPKARKRIIEIDRLLLRCRGDKTGSPPFATLLDGLVHTILSQNTSDINSHRAFESLKSRFPDWGEVAEADTEEIEEAIKSGGISRVKAQRIKVLLEMLSNEFGAYSLENLREMEPEEALDYLLGLPGVGRKTAAVLLLFQLGYPYFPVDTHILRVGKRLGILPIKINPEGAHDLMDALVPDDIKYRLHVNLIEHGRMTCQARKPKCDACCLNRICPRIGLKEEESENA
jgi:endonuclease III